MITPSQISNFLQCQQVKDKWRIGSDHWCSEIFTKCRNFRPISSFLSHWRIFRSFGDVTITWRATNFDLTPPLIDIEQWGFLKCDTYCDTDQPSIMVISEDQWHSHLVPNVWQWCCHYHYLFERFTSVPTGDRTLISRMRDECSTTKPSRRSQSIWNCTMQ